MFIPFNYFFFNLIQESSQSSEQTDRANVINSQEKIGVKKTQRRRQIKKCAAKNCTNSTNTKFFTFPAVVKNNEVDEENIKRYANI